MKKLIFGIALLVSAGVMAQTNIQVLYGTNGSFNSTIERFKPDAKGSTFFFSDLFYTENGPKEAYFEIARELKFWDGPISAHVEYNGGLHTDILNSTNFHINNAYLLGATYSWNASDFSKGFSLSAMYKHIQANPYNKPSNIQLTGVWYMNLLKNKLSFTGFADFWTEEHFVIGAAEPAGFVFYSEPQLWYNFNKTLSAGGEIRIGYNFGVTEGLEIIPALGIKVNL